MSDYLKDYISRANNVKIVLSLSDHATKEDLKNITHVDTTSFALKTNLASLKTEVDKLDIPKLTRISAGLSKLTKEVQEDFTKKTDFDLLEKKVDDNKSDQETKISDLVKEEFCY